MTDSPKDSWIPITVDVADEIARTLSAKHMGVIKTCGKIYLIHDGKPTRVNLLPHQLTVRGIRTVVQENNPWPESTS